MRPVEPVQPVVLKPVQVPPPESLGIRTDDLPAVQVPEPAKLGITLD